MTITDTTHVQEKGFGQIVVVARPTFETKAEDYLPCDGCLGVFSERWPVETQASMSAGW